MNTQVVETTSLGSPSAWPGAPRAPVVACWVQHGGEMPWATQIARTLRDQGLMIRFVSFLTEMHEGYREQGFPSDFLGEVYTGPEIAQAQLCELERRYGPPGLRTISESDVHLR